jgi:hypothetical protein
MKDNCRLCGQSEVLQQSHVWPKLAYRRFVADDSIAGKFVDLAKGELTNRQYSFPWFCKGCEQRISTSEHYFASWYDKNKPFESKIEYQQPLLDFLVSMSMRVAILTLEHDELHHKNLRKAVNAWRDYLRGKKRDVGTFSQHLFIAYDHSEIHRHNALGGQMFPQDDVILSRIGPLHIVAQLERKGLSQKEIKIWEKSKIQTCGTVSSIKSWNVGGDITMQLIKLLWRKYEIELRDKIKAHVKSNSKLHRQLLDLERKK